MSNKNILKGQFSGSDIKPVKIQEIVSDILDNENVILEDHDIYSTVGKLNKFEFLVTNFEKYDRRKHEDEGEKNKYQDIRNTDKNTMAANLLGMMKDKISNFENELNIARKIQAKLMPQKTLSFTGYDICTSYIPSKQVSGDYYDFYHLNDGNLLLIISDVSGKGIPSSLTVAGMKAYIKAQVEENKPIDILIKNLNHYLVETLIPEAFVTMFVGKIDIERSTFTYINAGHNPPVILKSGSKAIKLTEGGTILGMFEGLSYKTGEVQFSKQDILTLYTDGITEAFNSNKEEFSLERLENIIKSKYDKSLVEINNSILEEINMFRGNDPLQDNILMLDDITLILIRKDS